MRSFSGGVAENPAPSVLPAQRRGRPQPWPASRALRLDRQRAMIRHAIAPKYVWPCAQISEDWIFVTPCDSLLPGVPRGKRGAGEAVLTNREARHRTAR